MNRIRLQPEDNFLSPNAHISCLFHCIRCARVFSDFAQHSSCQCSCTLPLCPPRGCSHLFWLLEQFLGCPVVQAVGDDLSMDIFPWRDAGCHSPDLARKLHCMTAQRCCVLFNLLGIVQINLDCQTSVTVLEPT